MRNDQHMTMGAGELLSMNAERWHRARPFRKRLVRERDGLDPDYAGLVAFEAGYFDHRPEINELLDAIDTDLASGSVYSCRDRDEIIRLAMMDEGDVMTAPEFDDDLPDIGECIEIVLQRPVPPPARPIPPHSKPVAGPHGSEVHLYQINRTTRRGAYLSPYLARVLGGQSETLFCARAFLACGTLPAWTKIFSSEAERAWACDDFLQGPPF